MTGVLGWDPDSIWDFTLKDVVVAYDAKLVTDWDKTSTLSALLYNLTITVHNIMGKRRISPKSMFDLHPYRKPPKKRGLTITPENFGLLREIGNAMVARGVRRR
jgi:hypothetical protein